MNFKVQPGGLLAEQSYPRSAAAPLDDLLITAIVASFNEAAIIRQCLDSLFAQRDVNGRFEVIVVDGMSNDGTQEIIRRHPEYGKRLRLLSNPRRLQVFAWNLGLREAKGTYYAMMSAHTEYGPRYFASCLEVVERTGATAVGGIALTRGTGPIGRAVAWCMSTPLGIGNTRFRYATTEEEVDHVAFMFARRDAVEAIGGFDETLPVGEDVDLNFRLRKSGAKIVLSPSIEVHYHVRSSLRSLARQMFRYGYWRHSLWRKHPKGLSFRVFIPPALVAALVGSALLATFGMRPVAALAPFVYGCFLAITGLMSARALGWLAALVPVVLFSMHVSYGTGWWAALATGESRKS